MAELTPTTLKQELVTLRDYVDTMFAEKEKALQAALLAQEKAVSAALLASDKAITKAETNAEKWRENANEWRGAMSDRDRELPSRREVETQQAALDARIRALEEQGSSDRGRHAGITMSAGVLAATLGAFGTLMAIVLAVFTLLNG